MKLEIVKHRKQASKLARNVALAAFMFCVGGLGFVAYVVGHFVVKFW